MKRVKKRLPAEQARRLILEAAEKHLISGGPDAVRVQTIARELDMTDAAIHYHFGNRMGLMKALLSHAGRQMKTELKAVTSTESNQLDLGAVAQLLDQKYRQKGYAALAMWLSQMGWKSRGQGMFEDLSDQFAESAGHEHSEAKVRIAALNVFLVGSALFGEAFLRSVGLPPTEENLKAMQSVVTGALGGDN